MKKKEIPFESNRKNEIDRGIRKEEKRSGEKKMKSKTDRMKMR